MERPPHAASFSVLGVSIECPGERPGSRQKPNSVLHVPRAWRRRGGSHRRAASERGFAIIEVLVSSILLALIVIGTFTAFDSSNRYHRQRAGPLPGLKPRPAGRGPAPRAPGQPALDPERDPHRHAQRDDVHGHLDRTVPERRSGTSSCGGSGTADYIKTTSTVTWPAMGADPAGRRREHHHAAGRRIADRAGRRRLGRPASGHGGDRSGAGTLSGTTGADGCVDLRRPRPAAPTTSRSRSPDTSTRTATRLRPSASRRSP